MIETKFEFQVGEAEKHHVAYYFEQFAGTLRITVDGWPVVDELKLFSRLKNTHSFRVGMNEPHEVRIETERPRFFPMFRKTDVKIFVDGHLFREFKA